MNSEVKFTRTQSYGLSLLIYATVVTLFSYWGILQFRHVQDWPSTQGVITEADETVDFKNAAVGQQSPVKMSLSYDYSVEGKPFTSQRISYINANDEESSYNPHQYQVGQKVNVFYNPANPAEAFLIPMDQHDTMWINFIFYSHLILLIAAVIVFIKNFFS